MATTLPSLPVDAYELFTGELDAAGEHLTAELATMWACSPQAWPELQYRPGERWYTPLAVAAGFEGWLITWPAGARLALHDHGVAGGTLVVVEGELTERYGRRLEQV